VEGTFRSLPDHRHEALRDATSGLPVLSGHLAYFRDMPVPNLSGEPVESKPR
jgi:hypothetical protein